MSEGVRGVSAESLEPGGAAKPARRPISLLSVLTLVFASAIAPLAYLGNLGFAPAVAVAGFLCLPLVAKARAPSRGLWILLALLVWGVISYGWSPAAPHATDFGRYKTLEHVTGLKLVLELALYGSFALAARSVRSETAQRALAILGISLTLMAGVILVEAAVGAKVYQTVKADLGQPTRPDLAARNVARGCYVLALLLWPLVVALLDLGRRGWAAALGLGTLVSALAFRVDAPVAALVTSTVVFGLVLRFGRPVLWGCVGAVVVYFIAAPMAVFLASRAGWMHDTPGHVGKASWKVRLEVWSFVDRLILARPLRGWGLDASRSWPGVLPLHPHDAAMQLWLELGPLGAGLAALFWAWLFSRIAALELTDRTAAAAAAASAAAYLTIGALSFGVWQEWWLALGAVAVAVCRWASAYGAVPRPKKLRRGEYAPL